MSLKRIMITAAVTAAMAVPAMALNPAQTKASEPRSLTGFTHKIVCDVARHGSLCWAAFGGKASNLSAEPYNRGSAVQHVSERVASLCGGKVTRHCPFTAHSANNPFYLHDSIVTFQVDRRGDHLDLAARFSNHLHHWVMRQVNGGTGLDFVVAPVPGAGFQLINVFVSNKQRGVGFVGIVRNAINPGGTVRLVITGDTNVLPAEFMFRVRRG